MIEHCEKLHMKNCITRSYKLFEFIQNRLIRAIYSKKKYIQNLKKMWNSKVEEIWTKASMSKNKSNQEILKWVVPLFTATKDQSGKNQIDNLVNKLIETWFYWCMLRYSIAFFQWRKKFNVKPLEELKTKEERDQAEDKLEQLTEVFDSKIGFIRKNSKKLTKMSDEFKANAHAL